MTELGLPQSALEIPRHYGGLLDGFVLDERDQGLKAQFDLPIQVVDTLMRTGDDRERVARQTLAFAETLRKRQ